MILLAAPILLFAVVAIPGPLARMIGVLVLAVVVGFTWHAAMMGSLDLVLLAGGAIMARWFGFAKTIPVLWKSRIAMAYVTFICVEFGVFALLITNMTRDPAYALPFVVGFVLCGLAFVVLAWRSRESAFARNGAGNFVSASPQASSTCA